MYIFLRILLTKYIAHVNTLQFIPLGNFETDILKNFIAKLLEYITHVNSA